MIPVTDRRIWHAIRTFAKARTGGVQIWVAGALIAVVGMAGLAVDSSYFFVMNNRLQISADSAALAGALFLEDEDAMRAEALKYAQMNLAEDDQILDQVNDVQSGHWDHDAKIFTTGGAPLNAVQVTTRMAQENGNAAGTFFASVLGFGEVDITASAVAAYADNKEWDVMVVQDVTGSFTDEIGDARNANQALLDCIVDRISGESLVGMVLFTGVSSPYYPFQTLETSYDALSSAISNLDSCGNGSMPPCSGTHVGAGMEEANALFDATTTNPELGRAMVIVGDGLPNASGPNAGMTDAQLRDIAVQQADAAAARDVSVYTIFYDENNDDTAASFFEGLVRGDGKALRTPDPAQLPEMLEEICAQVPPRLVQ
jgi:hypothetical protein